MISYFLDDIIQCFLVKQILWTIVSLPTTSSAYSSFPQKKQRLSNKGFDFQTRNLYNTLAELELTEMNLKRFLLLGNILLSGLIIWVGVSIVTTWASSRQAGDSALSVPSKMSMPKDLTSSKGKRLEDYGLIASKDVFHTTKETAKTAGKDQGEEIKVTELNLELKGTVVGDGKDSYAFILDRGSRKEEVYYANDFVMGAQDCQDHEGPGHSECGRKGRGPSYGG